MLSRRCCHVANRPRGADAVTLISCFCFLSHLCLWGADAVTLRVISTMSGAVLSSELMLKAAPPGSGAAQQVQAAYLGSYRRKDKPDGFRYMLWRSNVQSPMSNVQCPMSTLCIRYMQCRVRSAQHSSAAGAGCIPGLIQAQVQAIWFQELLYRVTRTQKMFCCRYSRCWLCTSSARTS